MQEITHAHQALTSMSEWAAFIDAWLSNRRLSDNTREAYRRDLGRWLTHCASGGLDPLAATFVHVNTYARKLEQEGSSPASVDRALSAMSSCYEFLIKIEATRVNPVSGADRPKVNRDHSSTTGLSSEEVDLMLDEAYDHPRNHAMLMMMADMGLRVSEVVNLDIGSLTTDRGKRVVEYTGKGGKVRRRALTEEMQKALRRWLAVRPGGDALFVSDSSRRLDRHQILRLVQMYAHKAGLPHWQNITPHSLRHSFATSAREAGVPLEDVQDAMGHVDPRTTRRYDRDRHNLDRDPAHALAEARLKRRKS